VIRAPVASDGRFLLIGAVRGLLPEATRVLQELENFSPQALGIGLSAEELGGLRQYFVGTAAEPVVPLTSNEVAEAKGLVRFGEVAVPNPSFLGAVEWADAHQVPVEPLDPSDERSASLFASNIGYLELVRRTVRERRLTRNPPTPSTPDEYALDWDHGIARGRGSRRLARARDEILASAARRFGEGKGRTAVLVDRERFPQVLELLNQGRSARG
jgi:hypothetical protein